MSGWFLTFHPRPEAPVRLFCLPPAGAGASCYRQWPDALGPDVEVRAVQLPGRENRLAEPPRIDVAGLAAAVTAAADRPYALFGHSMGGRLAYEVIRELRRTGGPLPTVLYVAGSRAPDLIGTGPLDGLSGLPDAELLAAVARNGSLPAELAELPDLRELILPALRADFAWIDSYRYLPQPPLSMPVVGLAGRSDRAVPPPEVAAWERHTGAGFTYYLIDGDHFFPQRQLTEVTAVIRRTLPGPEGAGPGPGQGSVARPGPGTEVTAPADRPRRVVLDGWSYWSDALLRTTGFPAAGLDRFVAPEAAEAADAYLAGTGEAALLDKHLAAALTEGSRQIRELAADPRFREAVTWQNPGALSTLDKLAAGGGYRPSVARHRELTVLRYWQRYCAKNETVGFFGPVCWARLDDRAPEAVSARPGPGLLRERRVAFESWALTAYGQVLADDPELRMWLAPVRQPHLHLVDRTVLWPPRPPERLSAPEATALAACDGTRTAAEVVAGLGLPRAADGVLLLERLVARGLLRWDADLPLTAEAERVLAGRIAAIGDPAARQRAAAGFARLTAARDRVAAAAGDPAGLADALAALDAEFTAVTGQTATRRAGQTYAGRRVCFEDTARDLEVTVGGPVLRALAEPLGLLLRAARWLCAELAAAYQATLTELYEELAPAGGGEVSLAELWFLAQGMLFGAAERPVDAVVAEFQRRWARLLGLADLPPGTRTHQLTAADLAGEVGQVFPDRGAGWSAGRLHSPDLQICAPDLAAIGRGEFTVVLGELHIGWAVFDNALFTGFHPEPAALVSELERDLGPGRVRLLHPPDWPRAGGRLAASLAGPTDIQLGFAPAPGADRSRLLPAAAARVRPEPGGGLRVYAPDGRSWPLLEVFSSLLAVHTVDSFKLVGAAEHTPRVSVDRLVVTRQTWRTTVGRTGLAAVTGDRERFLAARRFRARLGLPERVFVRVDTETKPVYCDFRSPHYVRSLCSLLRSAAAEDGEAVAVTLTEMLPTPEQAWVPDAAGNRYFSELRIQVGERDD